MIRLDEEVDVNIYERYYGSEYSNQQKNQKKNQPTHFSLERQANGFDKVRYYRIISK